MRLPAGKKRKIQADKMNNTEEKYITHDEYYIYT